MKLKRGYLICVLATLCLGVGALVFAFSPPPRNGPRRPGHSVATKRPEVQTDEGDLKASESDVIRENSVDGTAISSSKPVSTSKPVSFTAEPSDAWSRFRGVDGKGISEDRGIPTEWNDEKNVQWKVKLPGPGSSSPVLTDKFVFVTSYSGYGEEGRSSGKMDRLQRQMNCIDRNDGKLLWSKSIDALLPEDPYQGMGLPEHGYATNTPVTDGQNVYAFFGKTGVFAFDNTGNELWRASVGTESGNRGWGTAASLVLYKDLVIVNASEESQSILALDKKTGKTVWSAPASTLELAYGTPVIVKVNDQRDDLVIAVPGEVWGLNPNTGKLVWYVETSLTGNLSPSVIQDGDKLYVFGGYRSSGSLAIQVGGSGDITKSHTLWTSRNSSYVVTPILVKEHLYWIDDNGMYFCVAAKTGELVQKKRVPGIESRGRPVYASPVAIDGKLYMQTRNSGLFVLASEPDLKVLSQNKLESDSSVFNATPAVSGGQLFLRSYTHLYCIGSNAAR